MEGSVCVDIFTSFSVDTLTNELKELQNKEIIEDSNMCKKSVVVEDVPLSDQEEEDDEDDEDDAATVEEEPDFASASSGELFSDTGEETETEDEETETKTRRYIKCDNLSQNRQMETPPALAQWFVETLLTYYILVFAIVQFQKILVFPP